MHGGNRRALGAVIATTALTTALLAPSTGPLGVVTRATILPDPCTQATLHLSYTVDYSPHLRGYAVTGAQVTGLPLTCADRTLRVTLTAADGRVLAQSAASTRDSTGARTFGPFDPPIPATDITHATALVHE